MICYLVPSVVLMMRSRVSQRIFRSGNLWFFKICLKWCRTVMRVVSDHRKNRSLTWGWFMHLLRFSFFSKSLPHAPKVGGVPLRATTALRSHYIVAPWAHSSFPILQAFSDPLFAKCLQSGLEGLHTVLPAQFGWQSVIKRHQSERPDDVGRIRHATHAISSATMERHSKALGWWWQYIYIYWPNQHPWPKCEDS